MHTIKVLFDSSANTSIICKDKLYKGNRILNDKKNKWSTKEGTFNTTFVTEITFKLPELNNSVEIYAKYHLTNKLLNYNLIICTDILHKLGIIFNFKNKIIT